MSKKIKKRKKPEILFGKKEVVKTTKTTTRIPYHLDDKGRRVFDLDKIQKEKKEQEERRKAKEAKKEERKRQEELASKTIEEKHRAIIERLAREIDAKQRLKASTSEGRAEIDSERRYIDECRKKWRNL